MMNNATKDNKIRLTVTTAMLAAIVCVATMAVRIPSPMEGYMNLGDAFVLLSGFVLGPVYGGIAGGLGSCIADLIGYPIYAPGTFVIKFLMAMCAGIAYKKSRGFVSQLVGSIISEVIMIGGYFLYAALLMGKSWAAAASIPGNIAQGVVGIVAALAIMAVLKKNKALGDIVGLR